MGKILIFGGAGYLGSVLCEQLIHTGHDIIVIDNLDFGQTPLFHLFHTGKLKFIYGDVTNETFMKKILETEDYDYIAILAAVVGFPLSEFKPEYTEMVNVGQVKNILKWKKKEAKILFPMTNSGYGNAGGKECTEESPLNPTSTYGKTKCEAEKLIVNSESEYVIFRFATLFGCSPRQRLDLMVNHFVWKAVHDKSLILFERRFLRNFLHVQDAARVFLHTIENWDMMKNEIYNVGNDEYNISKLQLAEMIKEEIPDLEIIFREGRIDPDRRDYKVSNAKILATGFFCEYSVPDGIRELIEGYKSMKDRRWQNFDDA